MERLRAALAELASADVVALPDQQVRDELLALLRCANSVQALMASRLDVFDTRELAELDGFRTARAWLRGFGRLSPGAAAGVHKRARVLRALPALQAAALDGAVSADHVDKVHDLTDRVDLEQVKAYDDDPGRPVRHRRPGRDEEGVRAHRRPTTIRTGPTQTRRPTSNGAT